MHFFVFVFYYTVLYTQDKSIWATASSRLQMAEMALLAWVSVVKLLRATDGCADSERSASPSTTHDHLALSSALRGAAASQVLAYYTNCYDPSASGPVSGVSQ